ncbi:MAG: hypothetical protein K8R08_03075 [Methanosarcinales archaeon]|nr:hypothetical protein [Methanosarcinales archaeon]
MILPGEVLIDAPLDFGFSLTGVIVWLAIVVVFSATASFYPPWKASRLTTVPDMRLPGNEAAEGSFSGKVWV